MARNPVYQRVRPVGAAEIFATIGLLVTAVSYIGIARDDADVPEKAVVTRSALLVPAPDIAPARSAQEGSVELQPVAPLDASP
jgi:hypothetical protein